MLNKDNSPALETESFAMPGTAEPPEEAQFIRKPSVRALIQVGHFAIFHHTWDTIRVGPLRRCSEAREAAFPTGVIDEKPRSRRVCFRCHPQRVCF